MAKEDERKNEQNFMVAKKGHKGEKGEEKIGRREKECQGSGKRVQTAEGAICGSRCALTNVSIPWQRVSVHGNPRWAVKIDWGRSSGT